MATCNPSTTLSDGKAFQALSARDLDICIVQLLCDVSTGSGGGGISSGVGDPTGVVTPTTTAALYVDTATGTLYTYYSGAWH